MIEIKTHFHPPNFSFSRSGGAKIVRKEPIVQISNEFSSKVKFSNWTISEGEKFKVPIKISNRRNFQSLSI